MASLLLIGGVAGVFWAAGRRPARQDSTAAGMPQLPAIAWVITAPLFVARRCCAAQPVLAWSLLLIPNALNTLWLGPVTTAVQHLVPRTDARDRIGSFLLINNLIGLGVGPLLMGALSDVAEGGTYGDDVAALRGDDRGAGVLSGRRGRWRCCR